MGVPYLLEVRVVCLHIEDDLAQCPEDGDRERGLEVELTGGYPDDRERARDAMGRLSEGHSVDIEYRVDERIDYQRWMWVQGEPVFDDDGHVDRVCGFARDVTERQDRTTELRRYRTIVETVGTAAYILDTEGTFTFVTDGLTDLTGYPTDALVGEHASSVLGEGDIAATRELIADLVAEGEGATGSIELTLETRSGEGVLCEDHLAPVYADGEVVGTAGVLRDISSQRARERQLQRTNERLEKFTEVVSHDLRNPLNVAQGRVAAARSEAAGENEDLAAAAAALDRMGTLIEELLVLAREGERPFEPESLSLRAVAEACWRTVETAEGNLEVVADTTIRADRVRLTQLLENLFANFVRHAGAGTTVTVGVLEDPDGFYVADDGPGIAAEEAERVFEDGYSTESDGTGLGLSIVEEIAESHGWTVGLTASASGGTRFEIVTDADAH